MDSQIFDTLLEPIFIIDENLKISYCNETAAILTGLSLRKLMKGSILTDVLLFEEPLDALLNLSTITEPSPYREIKFSAPHASEGKVQITVQPFSLIENEKKWILFVRDVTLEERLQKKYHAELDAKEDVIVKLQDAQIELQNYSKNLEKMVEERTHEITLLNRQMKALLDSLHQGFFMFNADGLVQPVTSKACLHTLESEPNGKYIWDVLKLSQKDVEGFKKWMFTVFSEMLPFEDLAPLGPDRYLHSKKLDISLAYLPLRNEDSQIESIVVMATDITDLVEAQKTAEYEKSRASMILNLFQKKKEISRFLNESQEMISYLMNEIKKEISQWDLENIFRMLHTLKGGAAIYSVQSMATTAHLAENIFQELKYNSSDIVLQNNFHSTLLVLNENYTEFTSEAKKLLGAKILSKEKWIEIPTSQIQTISNKLTTIKNSVAQQLAHDIQAEFLYSKIQDHFTIFSDLIQSIAQSEGKKISPLIIDSKNIRIDSSYYETVFSTLVHAFRNAVDHGIETPEIRRELGKSEIGHIEIRFQKIQTLNRNHLLIQIIDDGGGIHPDRIRKKLYEKGIQNSHWTDAQVIQQVFAPDFSTKDTVTDLSGRGVGMDAIQYSCQNIHGRCWVKSRIHKGSTLYLLLPFHGLETIRIPISEAA